MSPGVIAGALGIIGLAIAAHMQAHRQT
jgi:hypothetical protein